MTDYPMLRLIETHGGWAAVVLSILPLITGVLVVTMAGWPLWWLAAAIAVSILVFIFLRSFVELIRVMIDMLLPK